MKCQRCGRENAPGLMRCAYCNTPFFGPNSNINMPERANAAQSKAQKKPKQKSTAHKGGNRGIIISIIALSVVFCILVGIVAIPAIFDSKPRRSGGGGGGGGGFRTSGNAVTFSLNYNGATGHAPQTQYVADGETATNPGEVFREEHEFGGWYTEPECTTEYDFDTPVTGPVKLYAKWYSGLYGIYGVKCSGNTVKLTVLTDEACSVKVMLYDDESTNLLKEATGSVEASQQFAEVSVQLSNVSMPRNFLIRAVLTDASGNALCNTYTCIDYTSVHDKFMKKTTADFPAERVLKFTESNSNNFAVISEGVEKVVVSENENVVNAERSDIASRSFVIENIGDELRDTQEGDELFIDYGSGYFITVDSFIIDGDTINIRSSDDYELREYIEYMKVDMEIDPANEQTQQLETFTGAEADNMAEVVDVDAEFLGLKVGVPFEFTIRENEKETQKGKFSGSALLELKPHLVIKWDVRLFEKDYFKFEVGVDVTTSLTASLSYGITAEGDIEKISRREMLKKVAEIPLGKVLIPFGVTGLNATIELTLPISVEFNGSLTFTDKSTTTAFFSYDTINGAKSKKDRKTNSKSLNASGKLKFEIGPKLEESIEFLGGVIKASLTQKGGAYLELELVGNIANTDHLCGVCFSGGFGAFLEVSAELSYKISKKLSGTPLSGTLYNAKWEIIAIHVSSISGFGWGECPNTATNRTGQCKLEGRITIADDDTDNTNNRALKGATVKIENEELNRDATTTTSDDGSYSIENLLPGEYTITVSKDRYIPATQTIKISDTQTNLYNATIEAISEEDMGNGSASGIVYDAVTGQGVGGLTLNVRLGIDTLTGDAVRTITTNSDGSYLLDDILSGNYTVYIKDERSLSDEAERYNESFFNIKVLGNKSIGNQNGSVTNGLQANQLRIQLHWGEKPRDLDSHLTGPTSDGGTFHTFYQRKKYTEDGEVMADLDLDDTSSYGPETTTIYTPVDGVYTFSVHDYSNRMLTNCDAMSKSGAYVEVFLGTSTVASARYYVPSGGGTVWTVFRYDSRTNTLTDVNTMGYESDPRDVG